MIRRILLLLFVVLFVTSCYNFNNPAEAQDNDPDDNSDFDGTFENYSLGTAGGDAGFNVQLAAPGPSAAHVAGAPQTNQFLRILDAATDGYVRAFRHFAGVTSGSFQVGFSLRVAGRGAGPEIEISEAGGGVAVSLFVETDGNLEYMTSGGPQTTSLELEETSFYDILVTGNLDTERFTVSVNGSEQAADVGFLESVGALRRLTLTTEFYGTGEFYIDNIVFDYH